MSGSALHPDWGCDRRLKQSKPPQQCTRLTQDLNRFSPTRREASVDCWQPKVSTTVLPSPFLWLRDQEVPAPIRQDATYCLRCPVVTVTVTTREGAQRSAFAPAVSLRVDGKCHARTEGLRKCCRESF